MALLRQKLLIIHIKHNLQLIPAGYPDISHELANNHLALFGAGMFKFFCPAAKLFVVHI